MIKKVPIPYEGNMPSLEKDVVPLCMKHFCPTMLDSEIEEAMAIRHGGRKHPFSTVLSVDTMQMLSKEFGEYGADEVELLKKEVEDIAKCTLTPHTPSAAGAALAAPHSALAPAAAPSGASASASGGVDKIPLVVRKHRADEARDMIPIAKGCAITVHKTVLGKPSTR